jgi:hypothetical protein
LNAQYPFVEIIFKNYLMSYISIEIQLHPDAGWWRGLSAGGSLLLKDCLKRGRDGWLSNARAAQENSTWMRIY